MIYINHTLRVLTNTIRATLGEITLIYLATKPRMKWLRKVSEKTCFSAV